MADAVSIHIEGLEEFQSALFKSPEIAGKHLGDAIKKSIFEIQRSAVPKTPISEGRLRGSFASAFSALRGTLTPETEYAVYVHEGTRPHWPPYGEGSSLARWAHLHGASPFVVARAISRKGTRARPFLKEGMEEATDAIKQHFESGITKTLDEIAERSKT